MDGRADDSKDGTGRVPGLDADEPVDDLELQEKEDEEEYEEVADEDLDLELEEEE